MSEIIPDKSSLRIELSDNIRTLLTEVMNELHSKEAEKRFWGILLEEYIRLVLARKTSFEESIIDYPTTLFPVGGTQFPSLKQKTISRLKQFVKSFLSRKHKHDIVDLLQKRSEFRIGFPEYPGLSDNEVGVYLPPYEPFVYFSADNEKRKQLYGISERFEDIFLKNVVRQLPKIFVEHFSEMYNRVELYNPGEKTFHVHNMRTYYDQLIVAKYVEHGAGLIWYQHGSHYGEFIWEYMHDVEHNFSDEFRTWGWKINEKDRPWKAYRLEKFKFEYDSYGKEQPHRLLVLYPKMYSKYKEPAVKDSEYLFSNIDRTKYNSITVRPNPPHKKHSHASELSFIRDKEIIVSSGLEPVAKEVSESIAVIQMNVPGTNFLECIYTDHPTIGLLRNDQPTKIIEPFYDFFLKTGVLHLTVESLVEQLNRIDIDTWWHEIISKPEYLTFKNRFTGWNR
jgi:hypothetical protein